MSWIIWIAPALVIAAAWSFVRWGWYRVDAGKAPPFARLPKPRTPACPPVGDPKSSQVNGTPPREAK